mgnify:CR=1 FL=1
MEIKFRGKRIDNGEWVYGNLIIHDDILRPLDIKYYLNAVFGASILNHLKKNTSQHTLKN